MTAATRGGALLAIFSHFTDTLRFTTWKKKCIQTSYTSSSNNILTGKRKNMSLASTIEVEIELPKPRMGIEDVAHIINDSSNERVPVKLLDEKEELLETPSQAIHFLRKSIASKLMTKMGPIAAELPTWDLLAEISDMIMKPKKNETEEHAIDQAIK